MSVDLTVTPWDRLVKIAPPGTTGQSLQSAADRYATTTDVMAAAADLWEEAALAIDVTPPVVTQASVKSVTQDGVSVTYADTPVTESHASRVAQQNQYMIRSRYFRVRRKAQTALFDGRVRDAFLAPEDDCETIIPVIP